MSTWFSIYLFNLKYLECLKCSECSKCSEFSKFMGCSEFLVWFIARDCLSFCLAVILKVVFYTLLYFLSLSRDLTQICWMGLLDRHLPPLPNNHSICKKMCNKLFIWIFGLKIKAVATFSPITIILYFYPCYIYGIDGCHLKSTCPI